MHREWYDYLIAPYKKTNKECLDTDWTYFRCNSICFMIIAFEFVGCVATSHTRLKHSDISHFLFEIYNLENRLSAAFGEIVFFIGDGSRLLK